MSWEFNKEGQALHTGSKHCNKENAYCNSKNEIRCRKCSNKLPKNLELAAAAFGAYTFKNIFNNLSDILFDTYNNFYITNEQPTTIDELLFVSSNKKYKSYKF